ncbi:hypothetical protein [Actinomyces oricola]
MTACYLGATGPAGRCGPDPSVELNRVGANTRLGAAVEHKAQ